jgi:hypothetical protein
MHSSICLHLVLTLTSILACSGPNNSKISDSTQPQWPVMPTLDDPLFYPQSGSYVPDAIEFQFNPTLRTIDSVLLISGNESDPQELLTDGAINISERGLCFRYESEGSKTVEVTGTNHMGATIKGRVQFVVQGRGASIKTCAPSPGARTYSLRDPFWKPGSPGPDLPSIDTPTSTNGPWNFAVSWENATWPSEWTSYAASAVERYAPNLLQSDFLPREEIKKLCPRFFDSPLSERKAFWALFIASIAYPESAYNPRARYMEPPPLSKWSEGLLQLSTDDYVGHGNLCNFMKNPERILNPFENIRCGVVILKNQIAVRKTLWPATYYYWSVLTTRKSSVVREVFRANAKKQLSYCNVF